MCDWKNDDDLFRIIKTDLYTSVIGDIMDNMNYRFQFLPPSIRPLRSDMFIAGRAMTVLGTDVCEDNTYSGSNPVLSIPFGLMLDALDDLKKNEVYICSGSSPRYALWGELMSTRALKLGASGAVVNSYIRDASGILEMNFPTFSYGPYGQDQGPRGKVIDFRVSIEIDKVRINPGDIIVGDIDGVCVVPKAIEKEVFKLAIEKARGEKKVKIAIQNGMSAKDAFDKYGIL
jgi:regulator of RNase E activity RraA